MWEIDSKGCSKCGVPQVINYRRKFFRDMPISYDLILIWGSAFVDQNDQTVFFNMGMSSLYIDTNIQINLEKYMYVEDFMWEIGSKGCSKCGVPQVIFPLRK